VFVLPEGPSQFVDTLRAALAEAGASQVADRAVVRTVQVPAYDPEAVVRALQSLNTARVDGVAMMTPETPQVRDAIAHLKSEGLAVVALASDLPNSERDFFIGVNSVAAGRTAGLLMGRYIYDSGEILVATNSLQSRDSIERRLGFDAVIGEEFPHLTVLPSVESHDDPERMGRIVREVLAARPGLRGVYSMGFGNTPLLAALRETGRLCDLTVIAHELTPLTRRALVEGEVFAVITQNVGHLARSALRVLRAVRDGVPIFEAQERIRLEVILRENLP
jgi:LacI family transcriptional regulator